MFKFRFTLYVGNKEVIRPWRTATMGDFLTMCQTFAENDMMYTVEFDRS